MSNDLFKIGDTVVCILDQPSSELDEYFNVRINRGFIGVIRGYYRFSSKTLGVYFEGVYNKNNPYADSEVAYSIDRFIRYELPNSVKLETCILIEQKERLEFF